MPDHAVAVVPVPASRQLLADLLGQHGCPLTQWGTGPAKTVAHLWRELDHGECRLAVDAGRLVRLVAGAQIRLRHRNLTLVEDRQVYTDGRANPVRRRDMQASVGEKMITGEDPHAAALRALSEELGVTGPVRLRGPQLLHKTATSQSYPGLLTRFVTWTYDAELPAAAFDPDGYTEIQPDKTSFWVWTPTRHAPF